MEKQNNNLTQSNAKIRSQELVTEIMPLLNDYFYGNFIEIDNKILIKLENGQSFSLTVNEVI